MWVENGTHHIEQCQPNGNSPQVSISTECRTKHIRRHRESMRKQVQGTRNRRACASLKLQQERCLWCICMTNSTETGEAGARHWCVLTKVMQWRHPGVIPVVLLPLSLHVATSTSQPGSCTNGHNIHEPRIEIRFFQQTRHLGSFELGVFRF